MPKGKKGKKGQKVKKKRGGDSLAKNQKELERLDKAADKIREDKREYINQIWIIKRWLDDNVKQLQLLCQVLDPEKSGFVTTANFSLALFDLQCPLTKIQRHILLRSYSDYDMQIIDYANLSRFYSKFCEEEISKSKVAEDEAVLGVAIGVRNLQRHCGNCSLITQAPHYAKTTRFMDVTFVLRELPSQTTTTTTTTNTNTNTNINTNTNANAGGGQRIIEFSKSLPVDATVIYAKKAVLEHLDLGNQTVALLGSNGAKARPLEDAARLADCVAPPTPGAELTVFFDFRPVAVPCPLLNAVSCHCE